ncbi:DUF2642 domain-containing protein [Fictibacillus barbaricus]|uniref:DUF2642 domain-containing protein n=1 Tax=Fictibacillus barbaricus TaxID=182136 RepID=A0ABU1TV59_9BACL|nr:DUF2642 domain-containing protein [Fictibacillus barbaricus]MDR7071086.1 hypothetical protein [Fictibacillus barbaricus]
MNDLYQMINRKMIIKMPGECIEGILSDVGNDILVVNDGQNYYYIPQLHVMKIKLDEKENQNHTPSFESPNDMQEKKISFRGILLNAVGINTEIHIVGKKSLHGIITKVLSDYFVFYSPIYKNIYIPLNHVKWLRVIDQNRTPFHFPDTPAVTSSLSRSFEEQLKKSIGTLVVFDMGEDNDKIGLIKSVDANMIQLINANCETIYIKQNHIKSIHFP